MMKSIMLLLLATFPLLVPTVRADEKEDVAKAQRAATAWLALTDAGRYGESWRTAAAAFRAAVTKAQWEEALKTIRAPLGALKSRTLKSATFTRSLPNAPAGEYVIIQFDTQFENKAGAVETVTPMREKDGSWRASGYFIK
jgi:hypothetical protein